MSIYSIRVMEYKNIPFRLQRSNNINDNMSMYEVHMYNKISETKVIHDALVLS